MNFLKNEWELFKIDMKNLWNAITGVFNFEVRITLGEKESNLALNEAKIEEQFEEQVEAIMDEVPEKYELDPVEHKIVKFLGEDVEELQQQKTNEGTQLDGLKQYAEYFCEYKASPEMCQAAFQKYYDKHALKMAINEIPVEQVKIIQNHADVFIQGQEDFGEGAQFIDSRVDNVFEKAGSAEIEKMVNIFGDSADPTNYEAERTVAVLVQSMVDTGVKMTEEGSLLEPFKQVLETKLSSVHEELKEQEEWNEDYQQLLTEERKCLYALNKLEQHETEKQIKEFEEKLSEIDAMFE